MDRKLIFEGEYKKGKYWNGKGYKIYLYFDESILEGVYEIEIKNGEEYVYKKGLLRMKRNNYNYINSENSGYIYNNYIIYGNDNINKNNNDFRIYKWEYSNNVIYMEFIGECRNNQKYKGKEYYDSYMPHSLKFEGEYKMEILLR